jgi:hypothetical protein
MSKMTSQIFEATEEFFDVSFRWRTHESLSFANRGNVPLTLIVNHNSQDLYSSFVTQYSACLFSPASYLLPPISLPLMRVSE